MSSKTNVYRNLCVFLAVVWLAACTGQANPTLMAVPTQPPLSATQQDLADEIDQLISSCLDQGKFSGGVLIEYQDTSPFEKGYGLANRSEETPITEKTWFRLMGIGINFV